MLVLHQASEVLEIRRVDAAQMLVHLLSQLSDVGAA
jgi:hypothetical protein